MRMAESELWSLIWETIRIAGVSEEGTGGLRWVARERGERVRGGGGYANAWRGVGQHWKTQDGVGEVSKAT